MKGSPSKFRIREGESVDLKERPTLVAPLYESEADYQRQLRGKVEKHIKNSYLKRVDAPVGVKPALRCWMELNDG